MKSENPVSANAKAKVYKRGRGMKPPYRERLKTTCALGRHSQKFISLQRCLGLYAGLSVWSVLPIFAQPATQDLGPLVQVVAQRGCSEDRQYHAVGGVLCPQASAAGLEDPDAVLRSIGESARQKIQALTLQAGREDAACSRTVGAFGGTSVGPRSVEELRQTMNRAALDDATSGRIAPLGMMLSIPGVTQVQYDFRALPNGPEVRHFKIAGKLEGDLDHTKLRLWMDGNVQGDKNLYIEYSVNYQKTKRSFPTWSPFLDSPGDLTPAFARKGLTTLSAKASFKQSGTHRNGVQPWQEYEYIWTAEKIGAHPPDIVKGNGDNPSDFAEYPYGGDWVGIGWGSETRFKQTRRAFVGQFSPAIASSMKNEEGAEGVIMSMNVKHETVFYFHIDFDGTVSGRGVIIYALDANLCAVATLTRQVNERVNFMKYLPDIVQIVRTLAESTVRRFQSAWEPTPPTITQKVDEALSKLPRIQSATGEAEIAALKAMNPKVLPTNPRVNYAYADVEIDKIPIKRIWGVSGEGNYRGLRVGPGTRIAPPTPKTPDGIYSGRFKTRPGRPGWYEDGKWLEQDPGQIGVAGRGPGWNRKEMDVNNTRENDSELRIFEDLVQEMRGLGLPRDTKGTIKMYTQRSRCSSCAGVTEQFSEIFPNILLIVTSR